jgi:hypothetical protein
MKSFDLEHYKSIERIARPSRGALPPGLRITVLASTDKRQWKRKNKSFYPSESKEEIKLFLPLLKNIYAEKKPETREDEASCKIYRIIKQKSTNPSDGRCKKIQPQVHVPSQTTTHNLA